MRATPRHPAGDPGAATADADTAAGAQPLSWPLKLLRADRSRRTRLHTSNGRLCVHPRDLAYALVTTLRRRATGRLVEIPWIPLPAFRYLARQVTHDTAVFEFSSGMSTLWYARRCREVHSVEHDAAWCAKVRARIATLPHVHLTLAETREAYLGVIDQFPEAHFDLISVDGVYRFESYERSLPRLKPGGLLLVDNTDADYARPIVERIERDFAPGNVRRFAGFPPGILHPNEATICRKP